MGDGNKYCVQLLHPGGQIQVRFSRCLVNIWDLALQPRERKEGGLIIPPAQIGHCRGEHSEKVALPQSGHGSAASASQAFEREPLAGQYSSGQLCKYKFLGFVITTGPYLTEK